MKNKLLKSLITIFGLLVSSFAYSQSANMPAVYEEPGGAAARGGDASFGVESIDPFTGALKIVTTDLVIPSNGGLDLKVVRNYQSFVNLQGTLPAREYQAGRTTTGIGWDVHFGRLWKAGPDGLVPQLGASNTTNGCRITNIDSRNNPVLELPDGSRKLFAASNTSETNFAYVTMDRWILRCLPTSLDLGNGGAIVISPDGVKYTFNFFHRVSNTAVSGNVRDLNTDRAYHVTKIEHPNGTYITLSYAPIASTYYTTLDTVAHSEGQSIKFNYVGTNDPAATNAVFSTSHLDSFYQVGVAGRKWQFNYVSAVGSGVSNTGPFEYLASITRPDGRKTSYQYVGQISSAPPIEGQFSLSYIQTTLGGEVFYTYDQVTFPTRDVVNAQAKNVVKTKQIKRNAPSVPLSGGGGVLWGSMASIDTWKYFYHPSTSSATSDFTDVSGPSNCITYEHYVGQTAGTGWQVGALLSRTVRNANGASSSATTCESPTVYIKETNAWQADVVAEQQNYRYPLATDGNTSGPRLSARTITLDGSNYVTNYNNPDAFGNPLQIAETGHSTSSAGASTSVSKTTNYTYFTDTTAWIIHKAKNETVVNAGQTYATPGSAPVNADFNITRSYFTTGTKLGLLQNESRAGVGTSYDYYTATTNGGSLSLVTDANSFATNFFSYKRGIAQTTTRQIDSSNTLMLSKVVNDTGTINSSSDGELKTTGYSYDGINQLTGVTTARTDDSNVVISISGSGAKVDTITRGNYKEVRQYDGFGELVKTDWSDTTGAVAAVSQFTMYDEESKPVRQYLPNSTSSYIRTDYDGLGRPTLVTQPDGSTIKFHYLGGNLTRIIDERGFQTLKFFRSFGDPSKQELVQVCTERNDSPIGTLAASCNANFQTTYVSRNLVGLPTQITQEGVTHTFKYDSKFLLFEEDHPEMGATYYTRDAAGNVTDKRVGVSTGASTHFSLDRLYRTTDVAYPSNGVSVHLDYYKNDKLKDIIKGAVRWDYLYDANNNLTREKLTLASPTFSTPRIYTFDYTPNALDAEAKASYPSSLVVDYKPDAYGRATRLDATLGGAMTTGFATGVAWYPNGQLKSVTLPNGLTTTYGQDARLRISTFGASGMVMGSLRKLIDRQYNYDVSDNVTAITDNLAGANSKSMAYDGLSRLRRANGAWGSGTVSYYPNNNIQTKNFGSTTQTFNYDTANRLQSITGTTPLSFTYDLNGNVRTTGRGTFGNYAFDDDSLLTGISDANGTGRIAYVYDGHRQPVRERYLDNWADTYKAYSLSGQLLQEEDVVNSVQKEYVYLGSRLLAVRQTCTSTLDTDGDGIPDCVEFANGMNKNNSADAAMDADGDGLSNFAEYQAGTNIYIADTDSDGLSDGYEVKYGLNPLVADSNQDPDGDGLTNLQEAQLGTNPTKADTDGDGIPDATDPNPLFNPAWLIPVFQLLLE